MRRSFRVILLSMGVAAAALIGACGDSPVHEPIAEPMLQPSAPSQPAGQLASVLYSRDIQPLTGSPTCLACHQGGETAPQRALGTFAVDSTVDSASLRRMLVQYGQLNDTQLTGFDAWVAAGRPETEVAIAPSTTSPTPSPTAAPSTKPTYTSPHANNWRAAHGNIVLQAGSAYEAQIASGATCNVCHTIDRLPDGSLPDSPASSYTCYSCHNGPTGR